MGRREDWGLIEAELARHPGLRVERAPRRKHDALRLHLNGRSVTVVMSKTPSDYRAVRNTLARLRRTIRELRRDQA